MHDGSILSDFYFQGVPQVRVLSVTLFSLKINDILNQLSHTVHGNLYVDALNIFCLGKDMLYIEWQLQLAIKHFSWTNKNSFFLSTDRTHCMHFCRVHGVYSDPEIFINQRQISVSDMARFLSIIFHKRIIFFHIFFFLNLWTRCDKSLNI